MLRGVTARIDLEAAGHNFVSVSRAVKDRPVIAVVKADGYGHGAVEVSRAFQEAGAYALAVAFVSEARQLRDSGIKLPVLVLFDRTDIPDFFDLDLTPVIHDLGTAEAFSREASKRNTTLNIHVKVDTGMGRMGVIDPSLIKTIASLPNLSITGLMGHLSDADLADMDFISHLF